jgi:hypothetical protein
MENRVGAFGSENAMVISTSMGVNYETLYFARRVFSGVFSQLLTYVSGSDPKDLVPVVGLEPTT